MERKDFEAALAKLKTNAPKRNFTQSVDLIINLKEINLKQTQQHVDFFMQTPHQNGKKVKVCALVGAELIERAREACDKAVLNDEFSTFDKKAQKKLATEYDYFVAQANIMTEVAKHFGRVFGPKGKMPNPKAGCVVPPNANLAPLVAKLKKTLRVKVKTQLSVKKKVGTEKTDDKEVVDNCLAILQQVINHVPNERNNIKNIMLKMTMSKPVKVGAKEVAA